MTKYTIVGDREVDGVVPGGTIEIDDDERARQLIRAGHVERVAEAPAKSASKAEWVDYAVSLGADRDEADALTKAELVERYGEGGD